jgi:hypothetical protein
MRLYELMQALAVRGIKLSLRLVVNAPRGANTNELRGGPGLPQAAPRCPPRRRRAMGIVGHPTVGVGQRRSKR